MAKKLSPPEVMRNLAIGHWVVRLVHVAAKLRLADLLKGGPRTLEDLATAAGVQPQGLYRILRTLASVGIFAETKGRRFKLTFLTTASPTLEEFPDTSRPRNYGVSPVWSIAPREARRSCDDPAADSG